MAGTLASERKTLLFAGCTVHRLFLVCSHRKAASGGGHRDAAHMRGVGGGHGRRLIWVATSPMHVRARRSLTHLALPPSSILLFPATTTNADPSWCIPARMFLPRFPFGAHALSSVPSQRAQRTPRPSMRRACEVIGSRRRSRVGLARRSLGQSLFAST